MIPNVLAQRYASAELTDVWSAEHKIVLERRLWLAVMRAQRDLGVALDEGVLEAYEAVVEKVDLDSIEARERVNKHDVKARIEEFDSLAGHEHAHKGMTSRDLTENVEQLQVRRSLEIVRDRVVAALARLAARATEYSGVVMVARSHNVPAQATTLGKRFASAAEELLLAYARLENLLRDYPLRGIKGPVGTQQDQLDLAGGDAAKVAALEAAVAAHLGFERVLGSVGQVYPRSLDLDVVAALVQAAAAPSSLCTTIRLMAGQGLATEGFGAGQVGSSAMPHKINSRSSERVNGLATILAGHLTMVSGLSRATSGTKATSAARWSAALRCPTPSSPSTACWPPSLRSSTDSRPARPRSRPSSPVSCRTWRPPRSLSRWCRPAPAARRRTTLVREHSLAAADGRRPARPAGCRPARPARSPADSTPRWPIESRSSATHRRRWPTSCRA